MSKDNRCKINLNLSKGLSVETPLNKGIKTAIAWSLVILSTSVGLTLLLRVIAPEGIL